jgi:hypothetical protein
MIQPVPGTATGFGPPAPWGFGTPAGAMAWLILGGGLLRYALALALGYGQGESYYVATARFLALSYFDQPPLFLWLTHGMIALGGSGEAWLRLPFVLMFAGTTWLLYRLGALLYGDWAGVWAALLLNLSAVFFVSVGSWVQPDGPLFLFLLAGTLAVARTVLPDPSGLSPRRAWAGWILGGLFFGLALLSKYHAVLILAGLLLFLLTMPGRRRWLVHPAPWVAALLAFLIFSPVLLWNADQGWVSFVFQGERGGGDRIRLLWLGRNIAGQALWLLPWIWLPLVWVFVTGLRRGRADPAGWFLCMLAIVPIVLFTVLSAWAPIGFHFHWQAPGYLLLFPLLGAAVERRRAAGDRLAGRAIAVAAAATIAVYVVLASHAATGWLRAVPPFDQAFDPTLEGLDWTDLRTEAEARGWFDDPDLFVVGTQWHQTGKIDVQLGDRLSVLCLCDDPRNLAFGWNQADFAGRDAVIIGQDRYLKKFDEKWRPYFDSVHSLPDIVIRRGGRPELTLRVFAADGFRPPFPLPLPLPLAPASGPS